MNRIISSTRWIGLLSLAILLGSGALPARAATEVLHLTASNITGVANGGAVSNWPASVGPNATQTTAVRQPLWYNSDPNLPNGRPVVRFVRDPAQENDPNGDFMKVDFTSDYPQPLTVFLVAYVRPVDSGNQFILDADTASANIDRVILYQPSNNNMLNMWNNSLEFTAATSFQSGWRIFEAVYNGTQSKCYTNGTLSASGTVGTGGIQASKDLRIGSRYASDQKMYMNGDIAEMIIYSGALTPTEQDTITSGLKTTYLPVQPVAAFSGSPTNGAAGQTVAFTDLSTGYPTSWLWAFGDGGTSALQNPSHAYPTAGTFTVSLSVSNLAGSSSTTNIGYIVMTNPPPPIANFSASTNAGYYPLGIAFTDQSTGVVSSWSWDFGDGSNSVAQNPLHIYTTAGVYTVALTAVNPGGSNTMTKAGYITVTNPPSVFKVLEFKADAISGLTDGQLVSNWYDTSWNGRAVAQGTTARKPFYATNRVNGLPAVQFRSTAGSSGNCLTNGGYSIAQPYTAFMVARSDGNNGADSTDVFLDGLPSGANRVLATLNFYGGAQDNFYTYANAGPLSFAWTKSSWTNWHVYEMQFNGNNSAVWVDGNFKLTAAAGTSALGGITLGDHRAFNNGLNGEMAEFVVYSGSLSSTDRYNVGSALCGKYGISSSYAAPDTPVVANFSATPTNGSAPQNVAFSDLSTGGPTNWSWTFGDGGSSTISSPTHTYSTAGVYTVALVVSGPGGSSTNTKTGYLVITNPPPPVADFSASPATGAYPLVVAFSDLSSGQVNTRSWTFGDGGVSASQNPTNIYGTAGVYTVTYTVSNLVGSNTVTKAGYITVTNPPLAAKAIEYKAYTATGLTNGQLMSVWPDSSGNGRTALQASAARQPFYATNRINGLAAVQFRSIMNASANCFTNGGYSIPQPYTVFMVARSDGNGGANSTDCLLDGDASGANRIVVTLNYYGGAQANYYSYAGGGPLSFPWTQSSWTNWHIYEMSFNANNSAIWVDGTLKTSGAAGLFPLTGMTLGNRYGTGDNFGLNGEMAEFVVYYGNMTAALRNEAGGLLARRYGLATGYPPYRDAGTIITFR